MKAIPIDINDYVHSGEGANGESLFHKTDPTLMVKLYNANARRDIIENELIFAGNVYEAGVPTPKPGDFITDGKGRYGIRFERILDKKSFSRACGDNPEKVEEYARRFARLCKVLHSTVLPKDKFPSVKEQYRNILDELDIYTDEERAFISKAIDDAPEGDTAIHGDLQFSNAIMSGDKEYFIDLGDASYGSPLFDLGMVLFTCVYDDECFINEVFHMTADTARKFWHWFVKEYFGEDTDPAEAEKMLRPYAALKLLIIERNAGKLPEYHHLLKG